VVPYGYDYTCEKGPCAGSYNSFNSPKSPDITKDLNELIDHDNLLNFDFVI